MFSNNQLLLDMQNVPQNDFLQTTNYDSQMLSYFVSKFVISHCCEFYKIIQNYIKLY